METLTLYRPVGPQELWVPAEDLAELNRHLVGPIEVIAEFRA